MTTERLEEIRQQLIRFRTKGDRLVAKRIGWYYIGKSTTLRSEKSQVPHQNSANCHIKIRPSATLILRKTPVVNFGNWIGKAIDKNMKRYNS